MRALQLSHVLGVISAAALVATLPERKLTKEFLESEIKEVQYQRLSGTITHCTIVTKSGFTLTGESACVDPNNYNKELGEKYAYENAFEKMWMPYGFWLHKALAEYDNLPTNTAQEEWLKEETPVAGGSVLPKTERLSFGDAVAALKEGLRVERAGWNGKGMWLIYIGGNEYDVDAPLRFNTTELSPYVAMKTADNKLVPWLASQTDVLAEDWQIVE